MKATVYGLPNCDTVKRARAWLDAHRIAFDFHDLRKQGLPPGALDRWLGAAGWEALVNRRGTTWRALDAATRAGVTDAASARAVLAANTSLVKRPVVDWGGGGDDALTVGFDADDWARRAASASGLEREPKPD